MKLNHQKSEKVDYTMQNANDARDVNYLNLKNSTFILFKIKQ